MIYISQTSGFYIHVYSPWLSYQLVGEHRTSALLQEAGHWYYGVPGSRWWLPWLAPLGLPNTCYYPWASHVGEPQISIPKSQSVFQFYFAIQHYRMHGTVCQFTPTIPNIEPLDPIEHPRRVDLRDWPVPMSLHLCTRYPHLSPPSCPLLSAYNILVPPIYLDF